MITIQTKKTLCLFGQSCFFNSNIAGVIKTLGGDFESGVSISEIYLLWDVPFVKAQFESVMSEINDLFGEAVIAEAINGIVYAARLDSDR